ncbi:kinetochore-associated Ndc80 complex subunit spc25 [Ascosphaera acerosa]|nr:kinetochore-associated Ndc80 complex subunit spc25 [Ascosphaera acerosa]
MNTSTYEPALSASVLRAPFASADAPSMADQLPSIQFGFEDLRAQMAQFSARFDSFIERGQKMVLEERNQFRLNLAELQEDQRMRRRDVEIIQHKTATHTAGLAKERAEAEEMRGAIAQVEAQRDARQAARDSLRARIDEARAAIAARLEAQRAHARALEQQAARNGPELDFWLDVLCLRVEGAGREDRLKLVFSHLVVVTRL